MKKYIDVSEWQGDIDWEQVKGSIDGAILRAGYGKGNADKKFTRNAAECNRLGIPCGAYWFSYALTPDMAAAEAKALLEAVKPYRMELPLAFDFEYDSVKVAERNGVTVTKELASNMVRAFCEAVEQGGYWALNYSNPDYLARYFDESIPMRFGIWLASWPGGSPDLNNPPRKCAIWQYTSKGRVDGIAGNVDMNVSYTDFADMLKGMGMNHLPKQYEDEDGSPIFEYTQAQTPIDPTKRAREWAKNEGMIPDNAEASAPITWGDYALQMFREYGPEDKKDSRDSGLLSD